MPMGEGKKPLHPNIFKCYRFVRYPFLQLRGTPFFPLEAGSALNKLSGWPPRVTSAVRNDVLAVIANVEVQKIETMF